MGLLGKGRGRQASKEGKASHVHSDADPKEASLRGRSLTSSKDERDFPLRRIHAVTQAALASFKEKHRSAYEQLSTYG